MIVALSTIGYGCEYFAHHYGQDDKKHSTDIPGAQALFHANTPSPQCDLVRLRYQQSAEFDHCDPIVYHTVSH